MTFEQVSPGYIGSSLRRHKIVFLMRGSCHNAMRTLSRFVTLTPSQAPLPFFAFSHTPVS
jgi:hypothetical protein